MKIQKKSWILLLAALFCPAAGFAQIVADFSGGAGTSQPDQWTGTSGNGWTTAWVPGTSVANAPQLTFGGVVNDSDPLSPGGGNYLSFLYARSASDPESGSRIAGFRRTVRTTGEGDKVDLSQPWGISFQMRFDSLSGFAQASDALYMSMESSSSTAQQGGLSANGHGWGFFLQGNGRWNFLDGYQPSSPFNNVYRQVNFSTLPLVTGRTYTFSIELFPDLADPENSYYNVTILLEGENVGDEPLEVQINNLGYGYGATRGDVATIWNSYNTFGARLSMDAGNSATFSLDALSISQIPEPSSLSLLGLGAIGWTLLRRKYAKR